MKNKKIIGAIVIGVIMIVVSFFVGMKYGEGKNNMNKDQSFSRGQGNFGSRNGIQGIKGVNFGGGASGEIISNDGKIITIKLRDGGSRIVLLSPSTKVEKTVDGVVSDIVIGKQVMVSGQANQDGSVNATSVQIRPSLPVAPVKTN